MTQKNPPPGLGDDLIERLANATIPGARPKIAYDYTSELEIREQVEAIVKKPQRQLSARQLEQSGVLDDPQIKAQVRTQKVFTPEERTRIGEQWIAKRIAAAKRQGRLMTEQQLADWRIVRKLGEGDRCRYIGPDRDEHTQAQLIVPRPHGQLGTIVSILDAKEGRILIFRPDKAEQPLHAPDVEPQIVDLEVREYTPGWLTLERIPQ